MRIFQHEAASDVTQIYYFSSNPQSSSISLTRSRVKSSIRMASRQEELSLASGTSKSDVPQGSDAPSQPSQTASDYITTQLQLEADAREALPYRFDHCTQPLGPLRQNLFSCLTCNPPPQSASDPYTPAAVCYSCSISCHGEHTLVELFNRRNFVCDCGTTRLPTTSPCTLRIDPSTGLKGPVHSQEAPAVNTYNQNSRNRFCACGEWYNAEDEKGTMFQCLGLAGEADGGCGEDWWHPECVVWGGEEGARRRREAREVKKEILREKKADGPEEGEGEVEEVEDGLPPGFPDEQAFDTFICYKCVNAVPWIKQYAGTEGFLPPVFIGEEKAPTANGHTTDGASEGGASNIDLPKTVSEPEEASSFITNGNSIPQVSSSNDRKRSAHSAELDDADSQSKKAKRDAPSSATTGDLPLATAYHTSLPPAPAASLSLFCKDNFRDNFCRCRECYPRLSKYPQLLEEEESYEPPLSESSDHDGDDTGKSIGSKSLLERGEAALSNVDRVRAIEGVMVYNHLKDKVKSFLQPFAESGQAVGAEDIKAYFEKLRGDEQGIQNAGSEAAHDGGRDGDGDNRREQSGECFAACL